jgi:transcription elongation GreA/GreB family factor
LREIEELKNQYYSNSKEKSEAYEVAVGDGWHDNFGFEQAKRDEDRILGELRRRRADLRRIVIVEKQKNVDDVVELNDYVVLRLQYEDPSEDEEEETFRLVGSQQGNLFSEICEITLNSPIGKTIYHKPVGYEGSFDVSGEKNKLEILRIAKTLEELRGENLDAPSSENENGPRLIKK